MGERELGKYRPMSEDEAQGAAEEMRRALAKCSNWPRYGELGEVMLRDREDYGMGVLPQDMEPLPPLNEVDEQLAA